MSAQDSRLFHVWAVRRDGKLSAAEIGLTREQLIHRVVTPYDSGRTIVLEGRQMPSRELDILKITATNEDLAITRGRAEQQQREEERRRHIRNITIEQRICFTSQDVTAEFITGGAGEKAGVSGASTPTVAVDPTLVFVVHGRDMKARDELYSFLESTGLHPLDWDEMVKMTGKGSPYIGEVIAAGFAAAQATIVLMTPDEEARLLPQFRKRDGENEFSHQPRPNVLLEAGMALALFPDRTLLVEMGSLRGLSDIDGRHRVRLSNNVQSRQALLDRLATAGCAVRRTSTRWQTVGDLTPTPAKGNS